LLNAVRRPRLEAEQAEHRRHADGGANGVEVDGGSISDTALTLLS
jgi:hypothetical protein